MQWNRLRALKVDLAKRLSHYFRYQLFDLETQEGRAGNRNRAILLTSLSSGFVKALALVISLALVPLTLNYLGRERFGLWMTISSAVAMIGFADLGVGSGLMNAIAYAHGKKDVIAIRRTIAIGFILLSVISLVILISFYAVYINISWSKVLNVSSLSISNEIGPTIAIVVIVFAISIPSGIPFKVQMGLQLGFLSNLWQGAGNLLVLFAILCVIHYGGGLPHLAAASVVPPVFAAITAGLFFFLKQRPNLRPDFHALRLGDSRHLASNSGLFLVLQIAGIVAFQKDNLIIADHLGVDAVAVYAVAFKLFSLPTIVMSLYLNALWPAYAEAHSRGDKEWIAATFLRSLRYSALFVIPIALALLFAGNWIVKIWAGPLVEPSWDLLVGLCLWTLLTIIGGNFSVLLNGLGVIRFQVITSVAMAISSIILSIWLVREIGIAGTVFGSVISLIIFLYIPTAMYLRAYFR